MHTCNFAYSADITTHILQPAAVTANTAVTASYGAKQTTAKAYWTAPKAPSILAIVLYPLRLLLQQTKQQRSKSQIL